MSKNEYYPQQAKLFWSGVKQNVKKNNFDDDDDDDDKDNNFPPVSPPIEHDNAEIKTQKKSRKEDYEGPFGFAWYQYSCSQDSFLVLLIYGFRLLRIENHGSFHNDFPFISETVNELAMTRSTEAWSIQKQFLLPHVRESPYVVRNPHDLNNMSTYGVFKSLLSYPGADRSVDNEVVDGPDSCIYTVFIDSADCHRMARAFQQYNIRTSFAVNSLDGQSSIQEQIDFAERRTGLFRFCNFCGGMPTSFYVYFKTPKILLVCVDSPLRWLGMVDGRIRYGGDDYRVVGATYGNGGHFRTRFLYRMNQTDTFWEYDGLSLLCADGFATECLMLNCEPFPVSFIAQHSVYILDNLLYVKVDCMVV